MQVFRGATAAEVLVIRLDAGEDVLEGVSRAVGDLNLTAGTIVSGSGYLEQVRLESPANLLWPPTVVSVEKQGPAEIVSLQGHVINGGIELTAHVSRRGEPMSGRMLPGNRVLHYLEAVMLRVAGARWFRVTNPDTHVPQFQAGAPAAPVTVMLMGRPVDPNAIAAVPLGLMRRHGCLPVARSADTLVVAMSDPANPFAIEALREATGLRIQTLAVSARDLMPALQEVLNPKVQG